MILFGLSSQLKPVLPPVYDSGFSIQALMTVILRRLRQYQKLVLSLATCLCLSTAAHASIFSNSAPLFLYEPSIRDKVNNSNRVKQTNISSQTQHTSFPQSNTELLTPKTLASKTLVPKNSTDTDNLPAAVVIQPTLNEPSLYALLDAEFAADRGEINRALSLYKQQSFKEGATAVFERALTLSLRYEDVMSSLKFARTWQDQNPDHVPAWFYVAHLALKAHDYKLASQTLNRILRYDPRADLSEILIGIYPTTDSDKRELLAALEPIDSEQNASLSVLKAGLLYQSDEPEVALIHINRALMRRPDYVPFITLKADILRKIEPAETVINYISQARFRIPNNKNLYLYEIRYLLDLKQSRDAWELLLEAHDRFDDAEITLLAALVSLDIEAYKSADKLLNILANTPTYLDQAYYYLGISAERQQRFEQAKYYLNGVMQEDLVLAARKKVVDLELLDDNIDAAITTLERLRQQFEVFAPETYVMQANILWQYGEADEAQQLLARATREYPNDETLLFARAQLLDDKEDYVIKRTLLNHLQALDPKNLAYQLSYAQLLLSQDQNAKQGLDIAQRVVDIRYDDPRYDNELHLQALNVLASSALANQNYQQVIDYLQTPYDVLPTLPSGVLLLRAYQGLGQSAKVNELLADLQQRFAFGQQDISDRVQLY